MLTRGTARNRSILPVKHRWEGRIGYPRRLLTALQNLMDDYGYTLPRDEEHIGLQWGESKHLEGIAEFDCSIKARKDFHQVRIVQLIVALILIIPSIILLSLYGTKSSAEWDDTQLITGATLLLIALFLIIFSRRTFRRAIRIEIEGESYQAAAEQEKEMDRAKVERAGVTSEVRLTIRAGVGSPDRDWDLTRLITSGEGRILGELESDIQSIIQKVEELLPTLEIPEIK